MKGLKFFLIGTLVFIVIVISIFAIIMTRSGTG